MRAEKDQLVLGPPLDPTLLLAGRLVIRILALLGFPLLGCRLRCACRFRSTFQRALARGQHRLAVLRMAILDGILGVRTGLTRVARCSRGG